MAQFTDKNGLIWNVNLDPVIAMQLKDLHQIEIVNLEKDPMLKLRSNPLDLVAAIHVICADQVKERNLTPEQFGKSLPFPPDPMVSAVEESIVSFFPTGKASHVREVLASYANMGSKTDELTTAKMRSVMDDPRTMRAISSKADQEIDKAIQSMIGSQVGT